MRRKVLLALVAAMALAMPLPSTNASVVDTPTPRPGPTDTPTPLAVATPTPGGPVTPPAPGGGPSNTPTNTVAPTGTISPAPAATLEPAPAGLATLGTTERVSVDSAGTRGETAAGQGNVWETGGPFGAQVRSLSVDPTNDQIVYLATEGDGIYKTTDGGATWLQSSAGLDAFSSVYDVLVHPQSPSTVYAFAWEGGFFRSDDGGGSWHPHNQGLPTYDYWYGRLAQAPSNGDVLYLTYDERVFLSSNRGDSWTEVSPLPDHMKVLNVVLAVDPTKPNRVFAGTNSGLFRSEDGAITWNASYAGMEMDGGAPGVFGIGIQATNANVMYAQVRGGVNGAGVYRSADGGISWTRTALFGDYWVYRAEALAVHPSNSDVVFAAASYLGLQRSTDGGRTWLRVGYFGDTSHRIPVPSAIALAPTAPNTVYAGGGSYLVASRDGGDTWSDRNDGLLNSAISALALAGTGPLYAGLSGLSLYVSRDSASSWSFVPSFPDSAWPNAAANFLAISPLDPNLMFAGSWRSEDGGLTWEFVYGASLLAFSNLDRNLIYGWRGVYGLYRSTDAGRTWARTGGLVACTGYLLDYNVRVAVDPFDDRVIYARDAAYPNVLHRSGDGGETWECIGGLPGYGLGADTLMTDKNTGDLFASGFGGVWRSPDGGHSWHVSLDAPGFYPESGLYQSPSGAVYAYGQGHVDGGAGVYVTNDHGANWSRLTTAGLPLRDYGTPDRHMPDISSMVVGVDETVHLGTSQHGEWHLSVGGLAITKAGAAGVPASVGAPVNYTISVANSGSSTAAGLVITDLLPDPLRLTSATWSKTNPAGGGTCSLAGSTVTCPIGDLAPGGTATVSLSTTLRYIPVNASIANMACWTATDPSPPAGQNCATAVTGVGGMPAAADLSVIVGGPLWVDRIQGAPVDYTVSVKNAGPGSVDNVVLRNDVDRALWAYSATWYHEWSGASGACDINWPTVTCALGTIPAGGTATVTIRTSLTKLSAPYLRNWACVSPADMNPSNNCSRGVGGIDTQFSASNRKVIFIQGINSKSECPFGNFFKERVDWLVSYLTGEDASGRWVQRYVNLFPWNWPYSYGDFRYLSYSGNYDTETKLACYQSTDTCTGIQAAANRLDDLISNSLANDPSTRFDLVAHSMGGLVAALWAAQHPDTARDHVNSVVTFDSPLQGVGRKEAMALGTLNWAWAGAQACNATDQSVRDLIYTSEVVKQAGPAGGVVPFYTIDATAKDLVWIEFVPGERTRIGGDDQRHVSAERTHSGVWEWPNPEEAAQDRAHVLECAGRAVSGMPTCSPFRERFRVHTGDTRRLSLVISPEHPVVTTSTLWGAGSVSTTLEAPDGTVIGPDTQDPNVSRSAGSGYEIYQIHQPQPGSWTIQVTGVDMPAEGADTTVFADTSQVPPPDEDQDGAPDGEDNCQSVSNASQSDVDSDGLGDACDPDIDNDGVANASDNCPDVANADQIDLDGDGLGEPCDGDNDNDLMPDVQEALHGCLSTSVDDSAGDPDADGLVNLEEVWLGTDPCVGDTDSDGCTDGQELPMSFDPLAWYDFYDVPVPANVDPIPNGPRDRAINMGDVLATLFYVHTCDNCPPNANGADYDTIKGSCDYNADTTPDKEGLCYDRSPGVEPNPPWEAGPPSGAIAMPDVLAVLAQVTLDCSGPP